MYCKAIAVFCFFLVANSLAFADGMCVERALTAEEVSFYDATLKVVTAAFPPPKGWKATVKEEMPHRKTVCVGFKNHPMTMGLRVTLEKITQKEKEEASTKGEVKNLKEAMKEAAQKGDLDTMMRLQGEYQRLLAGQTTKMQKNMESSMRNRNPSSSKPPKIEITVIINSTGETIAKKYDWPMAGVAKAFETGRGDDINRKIYIGHWNVANFDEKNWKLSRGNISHTQMKTLLILVSGKKARAEKYLNRIDMGALKAMVK